MKIKTKNLPMIFKKKIYNFLRWSQKWTKTDMIYLAKNGFWLNLGKSISAIVNLSLTIAFANLLKPEIYGTFKFTISFISILSIPTLTGMGTSLVRTVAKGNEETFYPIIKTKLRWGLLGGILTLIVSGYYYYNSNNTMTIIFLIVAGFIPIFDTLNIWTNYLNGKKEFKTLSKYQVLANIIKVTIMITTVFLTQNIFIIIFVHFTSNTLIRLLFLNLSLKKYPPNKKCDLSSISYGKHLSLMGILGVIANRIDNLLIFHYLGAIQVAVYIFALRPVSEIQGILLGGIGNLMLPKLSQRNIKDLKKTIPGKMIKMFLILIPIVIVYILIVPYFFQIFLPKYTESVIYSQIFSLTILLFPVSLINQTLTAHAKKKQLYLLNFIVPTFKIILFLILLPMYEIWGAIIALLSVQIFNFILLLIFLYRKKGFIDTFFISVYNKVTFYQKNK